MAKRDYFLVTDTETTQDGLVADFAAVIVDKKGKIYSQCAVLVAGVYNDSINHPLFFSPDDNEPASIWSKNGQTRRYKMYNEMLADGRRMLASVAAINRWLEKAKELYNPIVTAYNLPFDMNKCDSTEINLRQFPLRFCLWGAAFNKYAHTRDYLQFCLDNIYFNNPTELGNWSFKTNAEVMARFVTGIMLPDEPHTALEDVLDYELPILLNIVNTTKKAKWLKPEFSFDWKKVQVKDNYKPVPNKYRKQGKEKKACNDLFDDVG